MITIYYIKDTYRDIKFAVTSMEAVTAYRMHEYERFTDIRTKPAYDDWVTGIKVKAIKLYGEDEV